MLLRLTRHADRFEDYREEIEQYEDLAALPRLHEIIKKVQAKQSENRDKLELLTAAYDQLKKKVKEVKAEQNMTNTAGPAPVAGPPKKDEPKTNRKH